MNKSHLASCLLSLFASEVNVGRPAVHMSNARKLAPSNVAHCSFSIEVVSILSPPPGLLILPQLISYPLPFSGEGVRDAPGESD